MREQIKQWLAVGNRAAWVIFGLFTLLIFGQTLLFDHFAFRELALQPSAQNTLAMLMSKLAASMLFASFTFLLRDKRWLIALSLVIDTWFIANLIYMRNNHILLDAEAFNMSGNLHGYFWSVLIYIEWWIDLLFYGLTALFSLVFLFTKQSSRCWQAWLAMVAISAVLYLSAEGLYVNEKKKVQSETKYDAVPFIREHREPVYGNHFPTTVANTSVLYSPIYITSDYYLMINDIQPERPLTPHAVRRAAGSPRESGKLGPDAADYAQSLSLDAKRPCALRQSYPYPDSGCPFGGRTDDCQYGSSAYQCRRHLSALFAQYLSCDYETGAGQRYLSSPARHLCVEPNGDVARLRL